MLINVIEYVTRYLVIVLHGRLDISEVPPLRARLEDLLEMMKVPNQQVYFIVDLGDVDFLDSNGLAVLIMLLRRARLRDGDVCLVWPKIDAARRVLRLTRFDHVFLMAETVEEARQRFNGKM